MSDVLTDWEKLALTIKCTVCEAKVGELCFRGDTAAAAGYSKREVSPGFHTRRVKESNEHERSVDIFKRQRDGTPVRAMLVLRWVLEVGVTTLADMKREFHRLGAVQGNIMHTFDRYTARDLAEAKLPARVLLREGRSGRSVKMRWCGSKGDTFEERAANWVAKLDDADLEAAHGAVETEWVNAGIESDKVRAHFTYDGGSPFVTQDEERSLVWLKIVKHEIAIRSLGIAARIVDSVKRTKRTSDGRKRRAVERERATRT